MAEVLVAHTDFEQVIVTDGSQRSIIVVRHASGFAAYENRCPHLGVGLDWGDGRCLVAGELVCAMHGARFNLTAGLCVDGPCRGDHLSPVAIKEVHGQIILV